MFDITALKMNPEYNEMVAAIVIGVLSAIFISAFVVLVIICRRQKKYHKSGYLIDSNQLSKWEIQPPRAKTPALELNGVQFNRDLESILANSQWIDDASGLIPHCLSILKTCRYLTEQLTTMAMSTKNSSGKGLSQIIDTAKKISSRVDDLVSSMYPPLDARLLEARAAALSLAVSQLVLVVEYECDQKGNRTNWIERLLSEMDRHVSILREASCSVSKEAVIRKQNLMNNYDSFSL